MITLEQEQNIAATIARMGGLSKGVGTEERACSIAAINLALDGRLTDKIPACMSPVIGKWIIVVQDAMPEAMRNSPEWLRLLPLAAGTGREHEDERLVIIIDWMWGTVLPSFQAQADADGYGAEWRAMCEQRTSQSARAAADAAEAEAWAAARAADAAEAAAWAAADAAAWAAASASASAWESFAPADLLARLIAVTDKRASLAAERKGVCPYATRCDCIGCCRRGMSGSGAVEVRP